MQAAPIENIPFYKTKPFIAIIIAVIVIIVIVIVLAVVLSSSSFYTTDNTQNTDKDKTTNTNIDKPTYIWSPFRVTPPGYTPLLYGTSYDTQGNLNRIYSCRYKYTGNEGNGYLGGYVSEKNMNCTSLTNQSTQKDNDFEILYVDSSKNLPPTNNISTKIETTSVETNNPQILKSIKTDYNQYNINGNKITTYLCNVKRDPTDTTKYKPFILPGEFNGVDKKCTEMRLALSENPYYDPNSYSVANFPV